MRWIARSLGFEKLVLRNKTFIGYFVADPQSPFYQSNTFTGILHFLQANPRSCRMKEGNDKLILYISNIGSVAQALSVLRELKDREDGS